MNLTGETRDSYNNAFKEMVRSLSGRWPLALPLFSVTLFISAFLLFLVQPLMGKLILPKLGGTPQVWNTCMVFFQTALLAGYAYTHTSGTRLKLHSALVVHCVLLAVALPFFLL